MNKVSVGDVFGILKVIGETENRNKFGHRMWLCECKCGTVKEISQYYLTSGSVKSCGCSRDKAKIKIGQHFGEWEVIGEADRDSNGYKMWKCRCSCGNEKIIPQGNLIQYTSTSCGCTRQKTMLQKYGEVSPLKFNNPRNKEQINALKSKDKLMEFIKNKFVDFKPSTKELSEALGINNCMTLRYIREFELHEFIRHDAGASNGENEIYTYLKSIISDEYSIVKHDRVILNGKELDIYIPELKIAIEFNGTYWHSTYNVSKSYHLDKSYECAKAGIRLIHIFEYEWENDKERIKQYLKQVFTKKNKIYARNIEVKHIEKEIASEFLEKYHLQGSEKSSVIQYGCIKDNELLGVMTFGKPRFDSENQYELLRLAWKDDIAVIGGAEKLLHKFKEEFKPESIVSYCNIAKFTGNVYSRLGFKVPDGYKISENYVWIKNNTGEILSRYQTRKSILVERGFGSEEETEEEIMLNLGYLRVYDCGNLKYIWRKETA